MIRRVLLLVLGIVICNAAAFAQTCPSGASWCSGAYAYDAMGNIRAIGADTYVYDTVGRLVSGTAGVQQTPAIVSRQDYAYDAFGNRTAASRIAGSVNCPGGCELSPAIDPVTNHITGSGAQYDAAGNLVFIQGPPDASYTYDAAGSLVHEVAGTDDRQFLYTADDERIATANGANGATWTWTTRGLDGKVLREFTSSQPPGGLPTSNWQWTKDYVWRDGLLLASVTPTASGGTATQHFHLDHLGTPRLVTGDNGVQLSVHTYYPFGAELNLTPTEQPAELMKFTGHERDLLANDAHTLDYMHARYEMGTTGRFLSVDPMLDVKKTIGAPQGWNRYAYVVNNPLRYTDPDGREHVQEPGFTKPLSEASWSDAPTPIRASFYAIGFGLSLAADEFLIGPAFGKVASAVVGAFRSPVLLGENMPRVTAAAREIGAKTFGDPGVTFAETMAKNMKWLANQVKSGAKILDIGPDVAQVPRTGLGVFYKAEVAFLEGAGYTRKFVRFVELNGKTLRMYQWVPK